MVHKTFCGRIEMNKETYRMEESDVERLNFRLIVLTVGMAVLYIAVCVWQALSGTSRGENLDGTLSVNPRSIIVLCWVAAAIGVAFMPEIGKVFAAFALLAVIAFFGYWGYITAGIRSNLQNAEFGGVGNWFIGASIFDIGTLLAAIALMVYDVRVIYKNLQVRSRKEDSVHIGSPSVVTK
jgi:hypothetical protein